MRLRVIRIANNKIFSELFVKNGTIQIISDRFKNVGVLFKYFLIKTRKKD